MYRLFKILLLILVIIFLCIYSYKGIYEANSTKGACKYPQKYDGKFVGVGMGKVIKIDDDSFYIRNGYYSIKIVGVVKDIKIGDIVSVGGKFSKDGYIILEDYHLHPLRKLKIVASILPLPILIWLFFKKYKFNLSLVKFEERVK